MKRDRYKIMNKLLYVYHIFNQSNIVYILLFLQVAVKVLVSNDKINKKYHRDILGGITMTRY